MDVRKLRQDNIVGNGNTNELLSICENTYIIKQYKVVHNIEFPITSTHVVASTNSLIDMTGHEAHLRRAM